MRVRVRVGASMLVGDADGDLGGSLAQLFDMFTIGPGRDPRQTSPFTPFTRQGQSPVTGSRCNKATVNPNKVTVMGATTTFV